jgi:hypothetical protein
MTLLTAQRRCVVNEQSSSQQQSSQQKSPDGQSGRSPCVAVARLAPLIPGVDGAVPIDVSAILLHELVHTLALEHTPLGIHALLVLELTRRTCTRDRCQNNEPQSSISKITSHQSTCSSYTCQPRLSKLTPALAFPVPSPCPLPSTGHIPRLGTSLIVQLSQTHQFH